jgi:hypothetical protein
MAKDLRIALLRFKKSGSLRESAAASEKSIGTMKISNCAARAGCV